MTHTDREAQYIKETGDKKPERLPNQSWTFYCEISLIWLESFSLWLEKQLEKAEEENKEKTAWSIKILKRLNKVDSLLDRCSGTIASVIYPEERREYIINLLDEIAHFNQE